MFGIVKPRNKFPGSDVTSHLKCKRRQIAPENRF